MKKKALIIITAAVLLVALTVTLIVVLTQCGADKYGYGNEEKFKSGNFYQNGIYISALDIEWISGKVEVVYQHQSYFSCNESAETPISGDAVMRTWFDGETLRIRPCASGTRIDKIPEKTLTVYVPMENMISFNDFDIWTESADITVNQVGSNFIGVKTSSGNINVNHMGKSTEVKLSSVSGSITYNHVAGKNENTLITSESGNLILSEAFASDSLKATTVSGNVELSIPETSGFTLDSFTQTGIVSKDGFAGSIVDGKFVAGNGSSKLTLRSEYGSIYLKKR